MDEDGDFVRNIVDDESDKSHVDASHDDSSSKVSFETYITKVHFKIITDWHKWFNALIYREM